MPADEQHCIKCGRPIATGESLCATCNRAAMATPSATQYHGTIAVAIVVGVVLLALAAGGATRGVGPYRASMVGYADSPSGGLDVTVELVNDGTRAGRAKCQLVAVDSTGRRLATHSSVSPSVDGGATVIFTERLAVDRSPAEVRVSCS